MARQNAAIALLGLFLIVGIANARLFGWRPSGGGPFPGGIAVPAPGAGPAAQQGPFPGGIPVPAPGSGPVDQQGPFPGGIPVPGGAPAAGPVAASPLFCTCSGGFRSEADDDQTEGLYDLADLVALEPLY